MFTFRLFGGASLERESGPLKGRSVQPRRIALLSLLASDRHHTVSREKLIAYLWPECDAKRGRHRLSESLYVLRKDLGEGALVSEGESIRLNPDPFFCDVISFSEALRNREMGEAVRLYAGPFMDGFFLKNAPEFDRWMEAERGELAEEYRRALETLATAAEENGDQIKAVEWWSRLASHDPYNSRFALECMQAMARAGDPGNAICLAQEHARFLKMELDTEPTPELLVFVESLRNGDVRSQVEEGTRREVFEDGPVSDENQDPAYTLDVKEKPDETQPFLPRTTKRFVQAAAGVILALIVAGSIYSSLPWDPRPNLIGDLVVVPPFENRTGDPALDNVAFLTAEWVESTIQQVDGVQVVPSSFARQYAADASKDGSLSPARAVAERAKANWVVSGAIDDVGDSLAFRAEIVDLSEHRKKQEVEKRFWGPPDNNLIDGFARRVAGALAYEFDPWMGEFEPGAQPLPSPPTIDAFQEHRLGYEAYSRSDGAASFQHHMAAYALDPTLVRALVAAAFMAPERRVADSLAQLADQRRHLLTRQGQLDLDIYLALGVKDHEGALRIVREQARLEGKGFLSVLQAWFAIRVNRPEEALASTERYDPTLEWRRHEAHAFWAYRTYALHLLGRFEQELAEAREGREVYPNRPNLLRSEVRALSALGRAEEVSSLLHQARGLADTHYQAALVAGEELREHGYLGASRDAFNRAVEWLRQGPPLDEWSSTRKLHLAQAMYGAERWEEAHELSLTLSAESPADIPALGMVGLAAARLGDPVQALEVLDRLDSLSQRGSPARHLYLMASILAVLDRPDEAMKLLFRAFSEGLPYELRLHSDMNLESLRAREDFRGLVAPKG